VEDGGAATGPLAGARVHPQGERAAVERLGGGARTPAPRANDAAASFDSVMPQVVAGPTRTETVYRQRGRKVLRPVDLGFWIRFDLDRFLPFLPLTRVDLGLGWPDVIRLDFTSPNLSKI
jgi:hypothetical protein